MSAASDPPPADGAFRRGATPHNGEVTLLRRCYARSSRTTGDPRSSGPISTEPTKPLPILHPAPPTARAAEHGRPPWPIPTALSGTP